MSKKLGIASAIMGAVVGLTSIGNASAEEIANQQGKQENTNQNLEKQGGNKQGNGDVNQMSQDSINRVEEILETTEVIQYEEGENVILRIPGASKYKSQVKQMRANYRYSETNHYRETIDGFIIDVRDDDSVVLSYRPTAISIKDGNASISVYASHKQGKISWFTEEVLWWSEVNGLENPLKEAKANAHAEVNQLPNLSQQEKNDFNSQIDNAKTQDKVNEVVQAAKEKDKQNAGSKLDEAKTNAKNEIDKLPNLTDQEKQTYKDKIDRAKTEDYIQDILEDAKEKDKQNAGSKLDEAKTNGKNEVNKLPNLSQQEKNDFNSQIDNAKTQDEVNEVVQAAKEKDQQNAGSKLDEAKTNAKNEIDKLPNLTDQEKQTYKDKIDRAKTEDYIQDILEDAKEKDKQNAGSKLDEAKTNGKNEVNKLPNLSQQEKNDFNSQIDNAKTQDEVNEVVQAAKEKDQQNAGSKLDEAKTNGKNEVNQLPNLSQQEKNDFNTQIDNAKTQDDVDKVVQAAKDKDQQNAGSKLEEAKTNGKNEVNKLPNLSQQEKNDFNSQIDNAKTQDDVDKIVQAAKDKDTENGQGNNQLEDAKINAHTEIDKLLNLTEQEKQKYKDKVDKANNIDAVNKVVTDAKKKDKNNYEVLSLAKEMAINTIGHLSSLDEGQKTNFVNQINAAKSVDEVNAIKDTAWNQSRK